MLKDEAASITLYGRSYAVAGLWEAARDIPGSRQFVQVRSRPLHGALAVSQAAHLAYTRALNSETAQADGMMIK